MPTARRYPCQRALRIAARTLHIASAVMVLGAIVFGQEPTAWKWALALSGSVIMADDLYRYGWAWFRWLQFWAVATKIGLVWLGLVWDAALEPGHWVALIIGSLISHAPGKWRHYALWGPAAD